jgi:rhodanese-related sulfurtransferase
VIAAIGLAAYVAWKQVRRQVALRQLRIARITVDDLHRRLAAGEPVAVIDLRHPLDFETDPYIIPGGLYIPAEELATRHGEIPRDRDVVLYCTCPDEITSAKEALRLRRRGIRQVRPLQGGFSAWRAAQYPVELRGPLVPVEHRILNAA